MGVSFKKGTFVSPAGTGDQNIIDVGFRPKALIIMSGFLSTESFTESAILSYGFSDGINDCVASQSMVDNDTTSNTWSNVFNNAIILTYDTLGAITSQATLATFLDNGFRVNWTTTVAGDILHYMAISGDDITNVKVGTQTVGTTGTGLKTYTGVGFQPDFLLTTNSGFLPGAGAYTFNATSDANAGFGISAMKSPTERWAIATASEDARATSDTWRYQQDNDCFAYVDNTTGTKLIEADFVGFNSDGWTWNYGTNTTANNQNAVFAYLAIKGGIWSVGRFTSPGVAPFVVNTDAGSQLKGIMIHGVGTTLVSTVDGQNFLYIGGSDGINQGVVSYHDTTAAANMIVVRIQNNDSTIYTPVANATAASSTIFQVASVQSFNPNSFNLNYTTVGDAIRDNYYWAVSELLTPHSFGKINTMLDNNMGPAIFG